MENFDARKTVTELLKLKKQYGIQDIRVDRLLLSLAADPDPDTARLIVELIEPWIRYSNNFLSPYTKPTQEAVEGTIKLGFTEQGLPVGFDEKDRHLLILGRTGVGKTTLLLLIFAQIIGNNS
jgi:DNA helicase HerA-like ATPase